MSRKRIAATMLVGVLGLAVLTTGVSSAAPGPYDQPPSLTLVKKALNKTRFKLKKTVVVGSASCGTGSCSISAKIFGAVRNKAPFKARVIVPSTLGAGQTTPIKVKLSNGLFNKIANSKTGHGHAKFGVTLTSSVGYPALSQRGNARYQAKKNKP